MPDKQTESVTLPVLREMKARGEKIAVLTAYDHPSASVLDEAGIDIILVGDSLGMVVQGYSSTIPVTMEEMLIHTRSVTGAVRRALVVADMPYMSFHLSVEETIRNAARFLKEAGAGAVKIEGASAGRLKKIEACVEAEIPVMGHVGLTPQSIRKWGSYAVRGRDGAAEAEAILADARAVESAGAFAVVLESIPMELGAVITESLTIPTIGIGAGAACDGQVLVFHDVMGYTQGRLPKFVKTYADLRSVVREAAGRYIEDVRTGAFPDEAHSYRLKPEAAEKLLKGRSR
jgi:3-methyl-2-oxobutanoate hydroxymethyltransferase